MLVTINGHTLTNSEEHLLQFLVQWHHEEWTNNLTNEREAVADDPSLSLEQVFEVAGNLDSACVDAKNIVNYFGGN